jgi:hypothetical protein
MQSIHPVNLSRMEVLLRSMLYPVSGSTGRLADQSHGRGRGNRAQSR